MADQIDSLSIEITANTKSAEDAINRLQNTLASLKSAVTGASNFGKIAEQVQAIGNAAKSIDDSAIKKLETFASAMKSFESVKDLKIDTSIAKGMSEISEASKLMNGADFTGIETFVNGIGRISEIQGLKISKTIANGLVDIGAATELLKGVDFSPLHNLVDILIRMSGIENIKISSTIAKNLTAIFTAAQGMSGANIDYTAFENLIDILTRMAAIPGLENLATALSGLKGMGFKMKLADIADTSQSQVVNPDSNAMDQMSDAADQAADSVHNLNEVLLSGAESGAGATFSRLNSVLWNLNNIATHAASGVGKVASVLFRISGASGLAQDAMGALRGQLSGIGKDVSKYGLLALPMYFGKQLVGNIEKATKSVTGFFRSIKRVAMYRLIRTAIRMITQGFSEGLKNLYQWSAALNGSFAKSMDKIATASQYLKNSLGAMASPLIEAMAPAIDFLVDKFVDFFNIVNQFFARLTGQSTYTAAKKIAAQWQEAGESAGAAADEFKRTILGFDEINKLNGDNGSGGRGSITGTDYSSMFETRPIEGTVVSFADQLKAAFAAAEWDSFGQLLGGKLNDLIEKIDFAGMGAKVGKYINAWFTTKYWTLDTINFTKIGESIATFLNNMIGQIDFEMVARTLVQKLTIIGDLIIGFFTNFDWGQAASSISDFVKGIYNEISKWLDKYDWGDVGNTIYTKLKDALTNLDLSGVAKSFVTALGKAIKAVVSAGAGFIAGFWADVTAYWDEHIKADDFDTTVQNILKAIGQGFSNLGEWVWNNVVNPFIVALTGDENWDKSLLEFGEKIWETIKTGVTNAVKGVGSWIQSHIFKPFVDAWHWLLGIFGGGDDEGNFTTNASGVGEQIIEETDTETMRQLKELGSSMGDAIKAGILDSVSSVSEDIWNTIKDNWKNNDRTLTVTVKTNVIRGDWSDTAYLAANMEDIEITRSITSEVKKGSWDNEAWTAAGLTSFSPIRTITSVVKKGDWDDTAWLAANMTSYPVTRTVTSVVQKGSWDATAWTAASMTPYTATRTVKAVVTKGDWDATAWTAASMTPYTATRTVKAVVTKGDWDATAWTAASMTPYTATRTVKAVVTKGDWDATAWTAASMTPYTAARTVKAVVTKGDWNDTAWTAANMTSYSPIRKVTASVVKGDWNSAAYEMAKIKNGSVTRNITVNVKIKVGKKDWDAKTQIWQWIWNGFSSTTNVPESKVKINATPGTGLKVSAGGGKTSGGGAGRFRLSDDLTDTSVKVDATPGAGLKVSETSGRFKFAHTIESTSVEVDAVGTWSDVTGGVLGALGIDNLITTVKSKIEKSGWSDALKALGLTGLKTAVEVTLKMIGRAWDALKGIWEMITGQNGSNEIELSVRPVLATHAWDLYGEFKKEWDEQNQYWWNQLEVKPTLDTSEIESVLQKLQGSVSVSKMSMGGAINAYAEGTLNAHGSLFMAGENGPEILGHVGGRTEVLNKSELAAAMYAAVRSAMAPAASSFAEAARNTGNYDTGGYDAESLADMIRQGNEATQRQNELLRQQNEYLRQINDKNYSLDISTSDINRANQRMNRRAGTTVVPVGT